VKKNNKPSLIITSDLHLRDDQPICRTDNFWETQLQKIIWLNQLQNNYDSIPIVCAGDIFHKAKPSPKLLALAIEYLPHMYVIPGNHDLPNHTMNSFHECGLNVLITAGKSTIVNSTNQNSIILQSLRPTISLDGLPYGIENDSLKPKKTNGNTTSILLLHVYNYLEKPKWIDKGTSYNSILKKYPNFGIVITGDNHDSFYKKMGERWIINPGCFTRQRLDEKEYEPSVYLYYTHNNTVERVKISTEKDTFTDIHVSEYKDKNERIDLFVESLKQTKDISLSFEDNLKRFIAKNKLNEKTIDKLWGIVHE